MSLIPVFELGLWNAWLFLLYYLVAPVPMTLIFRIGAKENWKKAMGRLYVNIPHTKTEKMLQYIVYSVFLASIAFSLFLPLRLDTVWFYVGLFVYLLGAIFDIMAGVSFATTPLDKPVTNGVYRISRNPQDFSAFLIVIGMGIACISWILLLLAILFLILMNTLLISEERWCLEKYGEVYQEYLNRTPRWIGIPKSEKKK